MTCFLVHQRLISSMQLLTHESGVAHVKSKYVQYYVEGQDEEKLINVLKTQLGLIIPGKVQRLNVVEQGINNVRLRALSAGTMVILVFDTDTGKIDILKKNIEVLRACKSVTDIVLIPQVPNLEGELVRSCNIRKIEELLKSKSKTEFKSDLIRVSNLAQKLQEHQFDIRLFWSSKAPAPYQELENQADMVKLLK